MPRTNLWTEREERLLKALSSKGVSKTLIASRVRRSVEAIRIKASALGLRLPDMRKEKIDRPPVLGARPKASRRKTTMRPCMCCRCSFPSEGAHHRLCGNCRHNSVSPHAL